MRYNMHNKRSSVSADVTGAIGTSILNSISGLPVDMSLVGDIHGIVEGDPGKKGIKDINDSPWVNLMPGVGHSRLVRRLQREYVKAGVPNPRVRASSVILNKRLTPLILGLAGAIGGGLIGNYVYNKRKEDGDSRQDEGVHMGNNVYMAPQTVGTIAGGIAGVATGSLINMVCSVAGALSDKKSKKETKDDKLVPAKLLVPGYGSYEQMNQIY
jgi:hypothetical protein